MKNSYEKVNIGEFFDVKKEYLGRSDYSPMYVNNNRNESSIIIFYAMINKMMT